MQIKKFWESLVTIKEIHFCWHCSKSVLAFRGVTVPRQTVIPLMGTSFYQCLHQCSAQLSAAHAASATQGWQSRVVSLQQSPLLRILTQLVTEKSLRMSTAKQRQRDETDKLLFYSHLFLNSSSNTWQRFWHWNLLTYFVFCASTVGNTQFRELIKCVHACSVVALISTRQSLAPPKIFSRHVRCWAPPGFHYSMVCWCLH